MPEITTPETVVPEEAEFPVLDGEDILVIFQVTAEQAPFTNVIPMLERETSSGGQKSGQLDQDLVNGQLDADCWNFGGRTLVGVAQSTYASMKGPRRRIAFRFSASGQSVSPALKQNAEKEFRRFCGKVWHHVETYTNPQGHPACIICKGVSGAAIPRHVLAVCEGEFDQNP